jgi:hypothetical protein
MEDLMDIVTLKKKLSVYVSEKGQLRNLNEEILYEVLVAWENWTGASTEFYRSLGFSHKQMAGLIGKAKRLKREGHFGASEFKQVKIEPAEHGDLGGISTIDPCFGAEILWSGGRVIRFHNVDLLLDFLKKSA